MREIERKKGILAKGFCKIRVRDYMNEFLWGFFGFLTVEIEIKMRLKDDEEEET